MRVALVWLGSTQLVKISVRYERYVIGLRELGYDVQTICCKETEVGYPYPVLTFDSIVQLENDEFWKSIDIKIIIVITWLGFSNILSAMKATGKIIISIADSDGLVGIRVYPRFTLSKMMGYHTRLVTKMAALKYWIQLFLYSHKSQDANVLNGVQSADRVIVGSPYSKQNLARFLEYYKRHDLVQKIIVAPYPIDQYYLDKEVVNDRHRRLVSIGRWDDTQKDAALLCATIKVALKRDSSLEFLLIGPNGDQVFGEICREYSQVKYVGIQTPEVIAKLLGESRSLLLSSRWESGPVVANEALAMGCSVIGPEIIPNLEWFCASGPYGTVCKRRNPTELAEAVLAEMTAWDAHQRVPHEISKRWRPIFESASVCCSMLIGVEDANA